jgi:hypothetical protein
MLSGAPLGVRSALAVAPRLGLAALLVASAGCGYTLVGRGVAVDPSIKRLGVPLFKDRTGKTGLDQKITESVVAELLKRGRFEVVPDATGVDAVVDGELLAYNVAPVGFSDTGEANVTQASRYSIVVVARVTYKKLDAEQPLWVNDSFSFRDEYDVGDAATFFDREDQAIDRLAVSFARSLVAAMLEAF